jgi:hypothetical protein
MGSCGQISRRRSNKISYSHTVSLQANPKTVLPNGVFHFRGQAGIVPLVMTIGKIPKLVSWNLLSFGYILKGICRYTDDVSNLI